MTIIQRLQKMARMLTVDELAEMLAISPKTLYAKAKAGTIPVTRLAGALRFDPALIADWLQERTATA